MTAVERVAQLRASYREVKNALPWLDASVWKDEPLAFPGSAHQPTGDAVMASALPCSERSTARVCRYVPHVDGPLETLEPSLRRLEVKAVPLVLLHTDVTFAAIRELALRHPLLPLILESGPRKLLYHIAQIEALLEQHHNTHLCTYNFCNWLGIERLCDKGFSDRLLYGSHGPAYCADASMGMVIMSPVSWKQKCDIAGNNMRRLLGMPPVHPPEHFFRPPPPFIVDAHAHNVNHGEPSPYQFATPSPDMFPADWIRHMDSLAIEQAFLTPARALICGEPTSGEGSSALRRHAPRRFRYWEVFDPRHNEERLARTAVSLGHPDCVGIKIHPSFHKTAADDPAYDKAYQLAAQAGKALLTHTWEISAENPVQAFSHPDRFLTYLTRYPQVRTILAHAGGRPSTCESLKYIAGAHPQAMADLAGDYFHNGMIEWLVATFGEERVLYGSDMDWVDPRCTLGMVLESHLTASAISAILRENALRICGN